MSVDRRPWMTQDEIEEARRLYCKGLRLKREVAENYTVRAIARKLGRHQNTILVYCAEMDEDECDGLVI